jgi:Winged helix-turn-helix
MSDSIMKYRSRTEIVGLILEAANGGAMKIKIMYKAFLSFAQLREYLTTATTEKRMKLLEVCGNMNKLVAPLAPTAGNCRLVSIGGY